MVSCLCCTKNMPALEQKVCPLCGHSLMGHGWVGVDFHWKARHELKLPFSAFWAGLCDAHRDAHPKGAPAPSEPASLRTDPQVSESIVRAYNKAVAKRSSHAEHVLLPSLIASIAEGLWKRDHRFDLQVIKEELDRSTADLVLACNGAIRYIQVEHVLLGEEPAQFTVSQELFQKEGGCAIILVYQADTLEIDSYRFFERGQGEPRHSVPGALVAASSGRIAADREMAMHDHYQDVPCSLFTEPLTAAELVDRLFPRPASGEPSARVLARLVG